MDAFRKIQKPGQSEFSPSGRTYVHLIPDDDMVLNHLYINFYRIKELILSCTEKELLHQYAKNKWSIKEVLVHLIDDERIYTYRALCFARNDKTKLPGFDQDRYATYSDADGRTIKSILDEYESVRMATLSLFDGLPDDAFLRKGFADNNYVSVRALAYHIAAHEMHHFNLIKERYLLWPGG